MTGKAKLKQLKKLGWREIRIRGSHHILEKDGIIVSVPVHGNMDMPIGLERAIDKITGLS